MQRLLDRSLSPKWPDSMAETDGVPVAAAAAAVEDVGVAAVVAVGTEAVVVVTVAVAVAALAALPAVARGAAAVAAAVGVGVDRKLATGAVPLPRRLSDTPFGITQPRRCTESYDSHVYSSKYCTSSETQNMQRA
jgi:hypothetical protein